MDVLTLSRLQFAATACFHFLFVPLTLGLAVLLAIMETIYVRTGQLVYRNMARFWGRLFLINFALGIVTGITLEFQFGTNWSRYSAYVGDVFGSLLAVEATVTFFLESTFVAVWVFGWKRLSAKAHCLAIWLVAIASNLSAFWILVANAWMKHPVGYAIRNGRAELTDFAAVVLQPTALLTVAHTLLGAYILGAFFVMGIAAWHLLRRRQTDFFGRSFRLAAGIALAAAALEVVVGHQSTVLVQRTRPVEMAAMESHWNTTARAPFTILSWPDAANERNSIEALSIPSGLSFMTDLRADTVIQGLKDWPPEDRPPVLITFLSFRFMVLLGFYFGAFALFAFWKRRSIERYPWFLKLAVWSIPLPYLANQLGWIVTELGRQPWIMYGVMRTRDAVSTNLDVSQVVISLAAFTIVYTLLGIVDFYLLAKYARQGPKEA